MDFKLLFSGGKDIPADVRMIYGGLIKRHQKLKNGWSAVLLRNNMAYLYKNNAQPILVGGIKRIFEAADGKFMLVKENGEKAVFTADGIQTAAFSAGSELYWNGWYKIDDSEGVSLFKANGECLGSRLKAAGVFANGCYFMSVRYAEDGAKAGIYGADGKRLLFTNDTAVKMSGLSRKTGFMTIWAIRISAQSTDIPLTGGFCLQSEYLCPSAGKLMKGFFPPGRGFFYYPYLFS